MKLFGNGKAPSRTEITELDKDTVELSFDGNGELKDLLRYIRESFNKDARSVKGKHVLVRLVDTPETVTGKLAPHLKTAGATLVAIAEAGGWKVVIPASQLGTVIPFSKFPKAKAAQEGGTEVAAESQTQPEAAGASSNGWFAVTQVDADSIEVELTYGADGVTEARELAQLVGEAAATITNARGKSVRVQFAQPGVNLFGFEKRAIESGFQKAGATGVDWVPYSAPAPVSGKQGETPLFADDEEEL